MDRRESHVAAGPSGRLGLEDRPLTISPKINFSRKVFRQLFILDELDKISTKSYRKCSN
jgi:hypothetical protein